MYIKWGITDGIIYRDGYKVESLDLYKKYLHEREDAHIHYKKASNGKLIGFAVYCFLTDSDLCCYIRDIFVEKQYREKGIAAVIADEIAVIAKEEGYDLLMGSVDVTTKHARESMQVLLSYGMSPYGTEGNMVYFKKSIGVVENA